MKKNHFGIIFGGLICVALVISNLYFIRKTMELNEQVGRIFELETLISNLKIQHQNEMDGLTRDYDEKINALTDEYTQKFETVKKALNAFEYELEEFYRNKHILKEDYLENLQKIREVQKTLGEEPEG